MNSVATEAVGGVPTRYKSTTATNADYIGDNFGFIQVGGTQLAATAHNWTVCTYTDQGGNASTLPSIAGASGAITDRLDIPTQYWFTPLESDDVGMKAWTQMQCSATVATGVIWFMIGHPLGFMSFPVIICVFPFDWLTNRDQAPRIFDDACIAFLEPLKPTTTATTYTGRIVSTSAARVDFLRGRGRNDPCERAAGEQRENDGPGTIREHRLIGRRPMLYMIPAPASVAISSSR